MAAFFRQAKASPVSISVVESYASAFKRVFRRGLNIL